MSSYWISNFSTASNRTLFSEDSYFATHNSLVLASIRNINLIFINLIVWLFIVAFYEMSSFVVIHVVICRGFDWKYKNIPSSKEALSLFLCYLERYYKCLYIYFNSRTPPFENPGYDPGNDGPTDWIWPKSIRFLHPNEQSNTTLVQIEMTISYLLSPQAVI